MEKHKFASLRVKDELASPYVNGTGAIRLYFVRHDLYVQAILAPSNTD